MKKKIILTIAAIIALLVLAVGSIVTTFGIWDGAIPSAKFTIKVLDQNENPISGAKLSIFEKRWLLNLKRSVSYNFPVHEFTKDSQPISNSNGEIEISHISKGLEIGGDSFALFWFIPITYGSPEFVISVQAPDDRRVNFDYYDLYNDCDKEPSILNKDDPVKCKYN
jgi:hypothetical protein